MEKENPSRTALKLALAAVFAALVFIATYSFVVYIPVTGGYFNLGEAGIYIAALFFGPLVGAFAGGIGAMVADLIVAPVFAPGTLIIKAVEGALVGFLAKKLTGQTSKPSWRICTVLLGFVIGITFALTGVFYYSGNVELYIGIPPPQTPYVIFIPAELWYIIGSIVATTIVYASLKIEPQIVWSIFSIIIGGLVMVIGYFFYEQVVLGKTAAVFEIPINIGQMLIGLIISIPVVKVISRSFPQVKR
jgi:uncharacterized membrane protein